MIDLIYTCDSCGEQMQGIPRSGMVPIGRPRGWYRIDNRDLCSLPCVSRYAAAPDDVPAQTWDPDPTTQQFKKLAAELANTLSPSKRGGHARQGAE